MVVLLAAENCQEARIALKYHSINYTNINRLRTREGGHPDEVFPYETRLRYPICPQPPIQDSCNDQRKTDLHQLEGNSCKSRWLVYPFSFLSHTARDIGGQSR